LSTFSYSTHRCTLAYGKTSNKISSGPFESDSTSRPRPVLCPTCAIGPRICTIHWWRFQLRCTLMSYPPRPDPPCSCTPARRHIGVPVSLNYLRCFQPPYTLTRSSRQPESRRMTRYDALGPHLWLREHTSRRGFPDAYGQRYQQQQHDEP
jgi:hypothetical protein